MPTITTITRIRAPLERVFDLARSIDLHVQSAGSTQERAIAGVTTGCIALGEEVTWQATHFGVKQTLRSKITAFRRPEYFQDTMVSGAFASLQHDHCFAQEADDVVMKDVFTFTSPFGIVGKIADLVLEPYLRRFLVTRNEIVRATAEGNNWQKFVR